MMRVLIVYESMFGSTRSIAEAIARGLDDHHVDVVNAADATTVLDGCDLLVVGGPTQAWGMSWPSTRRSAPIRAEKVGSDLTLEPGAEKNAGVREWIAALGHEAVEAAAFDTRIKAPALFTGRASTRIARRLSRHGLSVIAPPESFLVDKKSHLLPGELERAREWGARLATLASQKARRT
jgi:Flavodoxin domain